MGVGRPGSQPVETFTSRKDVPAYMTGESQPPPSSGDDTVFQHYLALLPDPDPSRRWKAVEGLARLGDPRALGPLVSALQDPDWRVRMKAAWALGMLGDPRAAIPLRRAMAAPGESERVKEMIEEAVQEIARKGMG
jgi:HEAT repeat protein